MKISFIYMYILVHLHVNKTSFRMKDFALRLALKERRKATKILHAVRSSLTLIFSFLTKETPGK